MREHGTDVVAELQVSLWASTHDDNIASREEAKIWLADRLEGVLQRLRASNSERFNVQLEDDVTGAPCGLLSLRITGGIKQ